MDMTKFGSATPKSVIYKSESHKLAHSFPVKTGKTILPGQLVVLNTDGTIQAFESGNSLYRIIGMAVNNSSTPAYAESKQYGVVEVTVALSGQAIIRGASAGALDAGPVKPNGNLYSSIYPVFVASSITTTVEGTISAVTAIPDPLVAIALTSADGADEMVMVLIK